MSEIQTWEQTVEAMKASIDSMHSVREDALRQCRSIIQTAAKCIRHVHRRQFEEAQRLLQEAMAVSESASKALAAHPELFYAGYLQDAQKEMVEAAAVLTWIAPPDSLRGAGNLVPSPASLGVGPVAYLNGLGEAASECRRYVLDELRKGNLGEGERLLEQMETIYDDLITFDYPDALTGGLRRTCDALRAVIERTRSDVTMTRVQYDLRQELQQARNRDVLI
ncbi:MAG: haloacid dehalogenase [Armatimonadetes bacterium]|nr:haloacid dehalogenase [Armatimonadota bacterium]